jgi:hypothetical protein
MAMAITLLTTESLAIIRRGSPVALAAAAQHAFDLLEPSLGDYGIAPAARPARPSPR